MLWLCFDLVTAGDPFYSFVATHNRVETLERQTGPVELVVGGPHRLAEDMADSGVLAAAVGLAFALLRFRRRSLIGVVAVFLAGAAFAILACAGLAVISRYLMLFSALLCVFAAVAVLGWRLLPRDDPWRRFWIGAALVVTLAFVAEAPRSTTTSNPNATSWSTRAFSSRICTASPRTEPSTRAAALSPSPATEPSRASPPG